MQTTKRITKLALYSVLALFFFDVHAQCPTSFTDWNNITRITYDGNWLLSENGQNYASTPIPTRTVLASNVNDEGFGLDDYDTDTNFTGLPVALENLPVIRVGKKFNQTGQGELSPVRRAHVATLTFSPTAENCKIRVHYIGILQEMSNLSTFYRGGNNGDANGALQRFRRTINAPGTNTTARNAASFGLFCRYEYESNAQNLHNLIAPPASLSRAGRTEFGLSLPDTPVTEFTLPAQNTDYGLNDMFCFSKAGTELRTLPAGSLNKKMNEWDSYVMDFSEFIGGTVTITLFGSTSNYIGETQNNSYCYYQFECLQDTPTPLPVSTLLDIPDMHFGGCLPGVPNNITINLTDTVPTIMGSSINTNTVQQINNGNIHRWLHLPNVNARRYHNHFASLRVQFLRNDSVWVNHTQIQDSGITDNTIEDSPDFRINSLPGTPTSIDANGIRTYTFKVLYSVRTNTSSPAIPATALVQEDTFNISFGLASEQDLELACDIPSAGSMAVTIDGIPTSEEHITICRPKNNSPVPVINLTLPASPCPDVTYIWQRKTSLTSSSWSNISGQTGLNFNNAQTQVHLTTCTTEFRRVTIFTTTVCGDTMEIQVPAPDVFTVYNSSHFQAGGSSGVSIFDNDTNNTTGTFSDISLNLNNNVLVCYGNTVTITTNLTLGSSCDLPVATDAEVSVIFLVNNLPVSATPIIGSDIPGNGTITQNFSFDFDAVNNPALGIDVFGASGAVSVPVKAVVEINRNGCISNKTLNLLTLQIFPRAIGGEILIDPDCPDAVTNDSETFTMTYAAEPGMGYVWQYCSDYTDSGGVLTCNDTWDTIPNQFQLNMPLAALTLHNILQPVIVRRVAQSGNNCGGAQYSNNVEIDFLQEMPDFDLPDFFCENNIPITMPQASPAVSGTWHLVTTNSHGNSFDSNPTAQLPVDLTAGNYTYIFIPASNTLCYAPVVWNFDVLAPVDAGTLSGNTALTPAATSQITATVSGGSWSSSDTGVATVDSNGLVTAIDAGTALITYTVPGDCPNTASITITVVKCLDSTVWNGTVWSNGTPNSPTFLDIAVIFNDDFTTTEDLYACSVTVNNNATVTVTHIGNDDTDEGHTFTVKHEITVAATASFVFEDDTSLVQIEDDANSGNIEYQRRTPKIIYLDYVYWSSPVAEQNLLNLSPGTPSNRFYVWNPAIDNWSNTPPATTVMEAGKGYIVRGPSIGFSDLENFEGIFTGVPHNGTITTPVVYNGMLNDNLIGNPYPSALDIDCFLADPGNAHLGGTILLWSHNIPIDFSGTTPGSQAYNYNVNSYVPYNRLGGVGSGITAVEMAPINGETYLVTSTDRPKGKVAAGQSFFIKTGTTGVATFKNSMRVGSQNQENSQFYRGANLPAAESSICVTEERHRLWLQIRNITPTPQQFKQTLVGYAENATTGTGLDRDYDFGIFDTAHPTTVNLYTLNPGDVPLMIQGRALTEPFNTADIIPLGFSCKYLGTTNPDTIQIAPSEFDGLFETTDFWLREDLGGGVFDYHDIKDTPFEFTITADINDDTERFAIVFTNPLPRVAQPEKDGFNVVAAPNPFEKEVRFEVITQNNAPVKVQLFDLLGKLVEEGEFTLENLKEHRFGRQLSSGVYQAVITQGNHKAVQKIIKQ